MHRKFLIFGFIYLNLFLFTNCEDDIPMCDSSNSKNWQIYCGGRILEAYNYFQITNDSKEYVDMPLILSPNDTIANFEKAFGDTPPEKMSEEKFKDFLNQHFLSPGHELLNCTPDGWQDNPEKLMSIVDPELREWALQLNAIWKKLCKEVCHENAKRKGFKNTTNVFFLFYTNFGDFINTKIFRWIKKFH
jgi:hypothetical protein